jgi:hypothetical protein
MRSACRKSPGIEKGIVMPQNAPKPSGDEQQLDTRLIELLHRMCVQYLDHQESAAAAS